MQAVHCSQQSTQERGGVHVAVHAPKMQERQGWDSNGQYAGRFGTVGVLGTLSGSLCYGCARMQTLLEYNVGGW